MTRENEVGNITVVCFADQWDAMWRRRQQMAYRFAQLEQVARVVYVEFPLTLPSLWKTLRRTASPHTVERWARVWRQGRLWAQGKVLVVTPVAPLSSSYQSRLTPASDALLRRQVRSLLRKAGVSGRETGGQTIFWATQPMAAEYLPDFPGALVCYDANDRFDQLSYFCWMADRLREDDEWLTAGADLVLTQVRSDQEKRRRLNEKTHLVPNGVDYSLFQQAAGAPKPPALAQLARPLLGYVGNVDDRLDYDLVCALATENPAWSFAFVGPAGPAARQADIVRLQSLPNVHLLGPVGYRDVPRYAQSFDVCLLPHRLTPLTDSQSPLKLFEYLATGRPVVSTPVAGLEDLREQVYVAHTSAEFVEQVRRALAESDAGKVRARQEAARRNSWEERVRQVWALVEERLHEVCA